MKQYNGLSRLPAVDYENELGLCPVCAMKPAVCFHVIVHDLMGEPEYSDWYKTIAKGGRQEFDTLSKKRYELMTANGHKDTRGHDEALRIETGRLTWTPAHERR